MSLTAKLSIMWSASLCSISFFFSADAKRTQNFPAANKCNTTKNEYRRQFMYSIGRKKETGWGQGEKQGWRAQRGEMLQEDWGAFGSVYESITKADQIPHLSVLTVWNWLIKQPKNSLKIIKMYPNDRCQKITHFFWKLCGNIISLF